MASNTEVEELSDSFKSQILNSEDLDNSLPVFTERTTITCQPRTPSYGGGRTPIPISIINRETTSFSYIVPRSGLDLLQSAQGVFIQQTVEMQDIIAHLESENRYLVKVPHGETLFVANEVSSQTQRTFCGSHRAFEMTLYDQSQQAALIFSRKLACSNCCFSCHLQELQVSCPVFGYIGKIEQQWTMMIPSFFVKNAIGETIYRVEGPYLGLCSSYKEADFKVLSPDGLIQQSKISYEWDQALINENLNITFPSVSTDSKTKALLLGAGFLLEYLYFVASKRASCFSSCR